MSITTKPLLDLCIELFTLNSSSRTERLIECISRSIHLEMHSINRVRHEFFTYRCLSGIISDKIDEIERLTIELTEANIRECGLHNYRRYQQQIDASDSDDDDSSDCDNDDVSSNCNNYDNSIEIKAIVPLNYPRSISLIDYDIDLEERAIKGEINIMLAGDDSCRWIIEPAIDCYLVDKVTSYLHLNITSEEVQEVVDNVIERRLAKDNGSIVPPEIVLAKLDLDSHRIVTIECDKILVEQLNSQLARESRGEITRKVKNGYVTIIEPAVNGIHLNNPYMYVPQNRDFIEGIINNRINEYRLKREIYQAYKMKN